MAQRADALGRSERARRDGIGGKHWQREHGEKGETEWHRKTSTAEMP
jgi:hypothetical protein